MTFFGKKSRILIIFLIAVAFSSCAARIDGTVREGGSADLRMTASMGPRTAALIRSLMNFASEAEGGLVLDGEAISRSMSAAPGIGSVSLRNTGPAALDGRISLTNVGEFMAASGGAGRGGRFITYAEGRAAGSSSVAMVLTRDSAPGIISNLSPEVEEYLSALMAPAVTGEILTRQEYLDLLASFYGRPLSDEIAAVRIRVFIEFPRPVTAVRGGEASGRQARFDIPLTDILVLEKAIRYEITW